jgi:hypothetical protein
LVVDLTPEELEAFTVFKVISKEYIDSSRLFYRDNKSYFTILIDDSNRKWVFRFYQKATKNLIDIRDVGVFEILNTVISVNVVDVV